MCDRRSRCAARRTWRSTCRSVCARPSMPTYLARSSSSCSTSASLPRRTHPHTHTIRVCMREREGDMHTHRQGDMHTHRETGMPTCHGTVADRGLDWGRGQAAGPFVYTQEQRQGPAACDRRCAARAQHQGWPCGPWLPRRALMHAATHIHTMSCMYGYDNICTVDVSQRLLCTIRA
jgi:hypothetical protein